MHPTRQEIKAWLKDSHGGPHGQPRDRAWLGQQCGVAKRTVDNWLSATNQEIPAAALALIARLMADDRGGLASAPAAASFPQSAPRQAPQSFSIEVDLDTFRGYNRAALAHGLTIEDWIIRTCDDEVARMGKDIIPIAAGSASAGSARLQPGRSKVAATRDPSARLEPGAPAASPTTTPPSNNPRDTGHWLDLHGGIAAGAPIAADLAPQPIRVAKSYPDGHYALKVFGRSMEPRIPDGSTIIVQPFQGKGFPRKGTIVIYNDGHGATLKELAYRKAKPGEESANNFNQVPLLKSLNPAFKDVQTMEGGRIDGVLVEVV